MIWLLLCYLAVFVARLALRWLNLRNLREHGHRVPPGFEVQIDPESLARSSDYTVATARTALAESVVGSSALLLFLLCGLLETYDVWIHNLTSNPVLAGVLFFLGLHCAQTLLDIPFSLYRTFGVEARFGFNRTGPGLWVADLFKSELVATVLIAAFSGGLLTLLSTTPTWWWLWSWTFFALLVMALIVLSPHLIEPLFFQFKPVQLPELEQRIRELAERANLGVSRVLQVDASRRSGHTNAYFSGIGRVKRILLFDTLLDRMNPDEVLAVLAHEIGHWKLHHVAQRLGLTLLAGLAALYLVQRLLPWPGLAGAVNATTLSPPARLFVLSVLASLVLFPLTPLSSLFSRRHERQADRYATSLAAEPCHLASALIKLGRDNLANLHPHPWYAWFYFSHPPLVERVNALRNSPPTTPPCHPDLP